MNDQKDVFFSRINLGDTHAIHYPINLRLSKNALSYRVKIEQYMSVSIIRKLAYGLLMPLLLFIMSCQNKQEYNGDSVSNYPDVAMLLKENLEPYQQGAYTFKLITNKDGKIDSSILNANQVDWNALKAPFLKANTYQKELDGHYKIDVFTDTVYGKSTMLLSSLDPNDITTKLSINARLEDNRILSMYAETREAGVFNTTEYKLLYVNGKSLQIQEMLKRPFGSAKRTIKTLTFLN